MLYSFVCESLPMVYVKIVHSMVWMQSITPWMWVRTKQWRWDCLFQHQLHPTLSFKCVHFSVSLCSSRQADRLAPGSWWYLWSLYILPTGAASLSFLPQGCGGGRQHLWTHQINIKVESGHTWWCLWGKLLLGCKGVKSKLDIYYPYVATGKWVCFWKWVTYQGSSMGFSLLVRSVCWEVESSSVPWTIHFVLRFTAAPGFLRLLIQCVQQFTTVPHALMQMCYSDDTVRTMPPKRPLALHPTVHEEVLAAGTRRNNLLSQCPAAACIFMELQALCSHKPSLLCGLRAGWHSLALLRASLEKQSWKGTTKWTHPSMLCWA